MKIVYVDQDAVRGENNLGDFASDMVIRCPAATGVVAAGACCWTSVFTGAG